MSCLSMRSLTGTLGMQLRQAKEAASVQDELVGFLQNRLAEVELGAAVERHAKQSSDKHVAASEAECALLQAAREDGSAQRRSPSSRPSSGRRATAAQAQKRTCAPR